MFYGLMACVFFRKDDKLSKLVSLLMATICLGCIKDMLFIDDIIYDTDSHSLISAADMIAIPMYAFILMELVSPGKVTRRLVIWHEVPFVALFSALLVTGAAFVYNTLVIHAVIYGTSYLIWTAVNIPRYNRQLKERFSYTENINLNWLRVILYSFYLILAMWIADCTFAHLDIECLYMVGALMAWIIILVFIYKHESVIDELAESSQPQGSETYTEPSSELSDRIISMFVKERIYLNPHLKVSDIATAAGTNRTYVSNFFNREAGSTFYDYVNGFRIEYACEQLTSSADSIKCIAERSGFNSPQSFIRVFAKIKGVSPSRFREENSKS